MYQSLSVSATFHIVEKQAKYIGLCQSTSTSSYKVGQPLSQRSQKIRGINMNTSVWDAQIPEHEPFEIEVTVRGMRPGLTSERISDRHKNYELLFAYLCLRVLLHTYA